MADGPSATPGVISTVVGGVGGPAAGTAVALGYVCGMTAASGYVYVGSGSSVRQISEQTGWLTTPAGTGVSGGPLGDRGPAGQATLDSACGVAVDASGNLAIADYTHLRVRLVAASTGRFYRQSMTAGDIYTVAGDGHAGFSGDGGPATKAELSYPEGVAMDRAGNLLIADLVNQRIRMVAASTGIFYGQAMTAGDIYTVAGGGTNYPGDGGPATAAKLNDPAQVEVDGAGNLVIDDLAGDRIQVVAASTGIFYGQAMTAGDIYTVAGGGTSGLGDGGPATAASLVGPAGVTVDGAGNLVISDTYHQRIRVVAASTRTFYGRAMTAGDIYTIAGNGTGGFSGDGGPATAAELSYPQEVAVDAAGNPVIADNGNHRVRVVAASTGIFYGRAMTAGDIYTIAGNGAPAFSGDSGPATAAELSAPAGVTVDSAGNLIIADSANNRIRVAAASTGTFYGQAMTSGDIYTVAGGGTNSFFGGSRPATAAELRSPHTVAVDSAGNLVFADTSHNRIRVVAASTGTFYGQAMTSGDIYTVAGGGTKGLGDGGPATTAKLNQPFGVKVDGAGNLVIADTDNNRIRVVAASTGTFYGQAMTSGDIYTIAGDGTGGFSGDRGPATAAELSTPAGITIDSAGNLAIADTNNNRIRVVAENSGIFYGQTMTAGDIYTVAGDGTGGFSGDRGPATAAELSTPAGITIDSTGNLAIADSGNSRIRMVATSDGTFYGQAMSAGNIYTVAGDSRPGFSGDGGPATAAGLSHPAALTIDSAGDLVIADTFGNRIRDVSS
jgi:secreted PhoX family phosphatase